ncbi:MAG: Putative fluoride ion transporter CrcB [Opitutia bacterium UBA7350]|nr:MAG: Putative fluoride ion transporter CrcB [Opitutae bacterium UBA7350]
MEILLGVMGCSMGGVARHLVVTLSAGWQRNFFPWGTLMVNILGSALMGASLGLVMEHPMRAYLLLGFCGGFTTFSAFSLQNITLLSEGRRLTLVIYVILSLGLSLMAFLVGSGWIMGKY